MGNVVAIVGRPNVGKSTFFNRLIGERKAIVDDTSGVTRDRHYGISDWNGKEFTLIDTGGFVKQSEDIFENAIRDQVKIAVEEANVIIFMVDVTTGITGYDSDVAELLRKCKKPVIIMVNKADNNERHMNATEFYSLGFEKIFPVSSLSGTGTGELLDELVTHFTETEVEKFNIPRLAFIGRPNVGKSSIVNTLLGSERNIVTDIAGTTRDSINTRYTAFGNDLMLIDTAGIRKKGKVNENIEFYSVMRSVKAIEESDVCIIMIDAVEGIQSQDLNLFHLAHRHNKGIVIVVNKWDLVEKDQTTAKKYTADILEKTAPFKDIPVLFISVQEKQRVLKVIETALSVYENKKKLIPTSRLNEFFLPLIESTPPPNIKGKYVKIKYITQIKEHPQQFVFFCNLPQYLNENYKRFLENKMRENFHFTGVPLRLYFRKK